MKGETGRLNPAGRQAGETRGLLLLGVLAFLAFCVALAPARLLAPLVERIDGASLTESAGTVWSGSGRLLFRGRHRGDLGWTFRPGSLLRLFPGIRWTLSAEHLDLHGTLNLTPGRAAISIGGSLDAAAVNPWLAAYEISMAGRFEVRDLYLHLSGNRPDDTGGAIGWSGGRLRYVLSQQPRTAELPPLEARLRFTSRPEATVFEVRDAARDAMADSAGDAAGDATPLLEAQFLENGFARIGVTMRLTRLLGQPWPGGGPDDKVVVAVEEKIL